MKKIFSKLYKPTVLPYFAGITSIISLGLITTFVITIAPRQQIAGASTTKINPVETSLRHYEVDSTLGVKAVSTLTPIPSAIVTPTAPKVTTPVGNGLKPFPTLTETPTVTPTDTNTIPTTKPTLPIITATPIVKTSTPSIPLTISPTPSQTINTVSLQLKTPDNTINTTITLHDGATVCDVLEEAKNEGKISSVTFDDTYISSLHSKYVVEINGYTNNWTFTVNGASPLGCSLSNPKPNDSIVWMFG